MADDKAVTEGGDGEVASPFAGATQGGPFRHLEALNAPPDAGVTALVVRLDRIRVGPQQMRSAREVERDLDDLVESIRANGFTTALTVKRDGDDFALVAGERRYRAAMKAGLVAVPVVVVDPRTEFDRLAIQYAENVKRADFIGIDQALGVAAMAATGVTGRDVAAAAGFHPSHVSRCSAVARLPDPVARVARSKRLSLRAAIGVADLFAVYRTLKVNDSEASKALVAWLQKQDDDGLTTRALATQKARLAPPSKPKREGEGGTPDAASGGAVPAASTPPQDPAAAAGGAASRLSTESEAALLFDLRHLRAGLASAEEKAEAAAAARRFLAMLASSPTRAT